MHSRLSFFLTVLLISAGQAAGQSRSDPATLQFTIQVASFPDTAQANRFAARLVVAGETPVCDTVEIDGRGFWTRVFIGFFDTPDAARRRGEVLVARAVITEFLVKKASSIQSLTRPRKVFVSNVEDVHVSEPLPAMGTLALRLAPRVDTNLIPRPDPMSLAFRLVTGDKRSGAEVPGQVGGLWMSGDTDEGMVRLRWIIGPENAGLIGLDGDGRVKLDHQLLRKVAGLGATPVEDALRALDYISSNEGLLLLIQITQQSRNRYLLHVGRYSPTAGRSFETAGSVNLDNNVDSRINPYRKNGRKLDEERPPEGFDSLIGLNPVARWFNLSTNSWVQGGEILFHELAEAHAKLEYGLDYLDQGSRRGAHGLALERESRLKSQRPGADIVMTTGSNRLLRTEEEIRLFYAEAFAGSSQR